MGYRSRASNFHPARREKLAVDPDTFLQDCLKFAAGVVEFHRIEDGVELSHPHMETNTWDEYFFASDDVGFIEEVALTFIPQGNRHTWTFDLWIYVATEAGWGQIFRWGRETLHDQRGVRPREIEIHPLSASHHGDLPRSRPHGSNGLAPPIVRHADSRVQRP